MEFLEEGLGEAGADVADGFVLLRAGVVGCQQEGAVYGGTFAPAVVGAENDEVEGVADASQVVFLDLWDSLDLRLKDHIRHGIYCTFSQLRLRLLGS